MVAVATTPLMETLVMRQRERQRRMMLAGVKRKELTLKHSHPTGIERKPGKTKDFCTSEALWDEVNVQSRSVTSEKAVKTGELSMFPMGWMWSFDIVTCSPYRLEQLASGLVGRGNGGVGGRAEKAAGNRLG